MELTFRSYPNNILKDAYRSLTNRTTLLQKRVATNKEISRARTVPQNRDQYHGRPVPLPSTSSKLQGV